MDPNSSKLETYLAYLYGELAEDERLSFEAKLKENPELKEELDSLLQVRNTLQMAENVDPEMSLVLPSFYNKKLNQNRTNIWIPITKIAASILVFFVLAKAFNINISNIDNSLVISMGNSAVTKSDEEVQQIIDDQVNTKLQDLTEAIITENERRLNERLQEVRSEDLEAYSNLLLMTLQQYQEANSEQLSTIMQSLNSKQQEDYTRLEQMLLSNIFEQDQQIKQTQTAVQNLLNVTTTTPTVNNQSLK